MKFNPCILTRLYARVAASSLLVAAACLLAPPAESADLVLGHTLAAHAITRGHNRKVIYDPVKRNFYALWLEEIDGSVIQTAGEGIVSQRTTRGTSWTPNQLIGFDEAGSTSFDIIPVGSGYYALGLDDNLVSGYKEYGVRNMTINADGSLNPGPLNAAFVNSGPADLDHFYGSVLRDATGIVWIAARVGDSTPGTHAEVIRSTGPDTLNAWGPGGCLGAECKTAWTNPYPTVVMERGTIANRLLNLKGFGIGLITYNKKNSEPATIGQLLFTRNPSGGHAGWNATPIVLTTQANQYDGANTVDTTRLDDRRFSAVVDPATGVIHVVYVSRDTKDASNGNLRYFTFSPPYASLANKSAEKTIVPVEVDGAQLSIDSRHQPAKVTVFYIENHHPNYTLMMLTNPGTEFPPYTTAAPISSTVGKRQYPQAPETVTSPYILVLDQENTTDGWDIVGRMVRMPF